ncbi:hypothetical protein BH24ACT4_BH24ACT4_12380 [soil metagenome]
MAPGGFDNPDGSPVETGAEDGDEYGFFDQDRG